MGFFTVACEVYLHVGNVIVDENRQPEPSFVRLHNGPMWIFGQSVELIFQNFVLFGDGSRVLLMKGLV